MVRLARLGAQVDVGQKYRADQLHASTQGRCRGETEAGFKLERSDFDIFHDRRMAWKYCSVVTIKSVIKFSSQSTML